MVIYFFKGKTNYDRMINTTATIIIEMMLTGTPSNRNTKAIWLHLCQTVNDEGH